MYGRYPYTFEIPRIPTITAIKKSTGDIEPINEFAIVKQEAGKQFNI
jgi:hypothetical protein